MEVITNVWTVTAVLYPFPRPPVITSDDIEVKNFQGDTGGISAFMTEYRDRINKLYVIPGSHEVAL